MAIQNKLVTRISTINELKALLAEIFFNNTDNVTKLTDESILNAMFFAQAKLAQKGIKDIAVIESLIFPDTSYDTYLDKSAKLFGVPVRLSATGSSTFMKVIADSGTIYVAGVNTFVSRAGIEFEIVETTIVDDNGFAYVPVRSIATGISTNSSANSINTVTPEPTGHIACNNEYMAVGGADAESDELFKIRIRNHPNIVAQQTLLYVLEIVRLFYPNSLRIFHLGVDENMCINLSITQSNGAHLTSSELVGLATDVAPYFSLIEVTRTGSLTGVIFSNTQWEYVDIDFRVGINSAYDEDDVRQAIQVAMTKYLDFRFWPEQQSVEWDTLLNIVKSIPGVDYVPDTYFTPGTDIDVAKGELPRIRDFVMRDLTGSILFDNSNQTLSVYYQ